MGTNNMLDSGTYTINNFASNNLAKLHDHNSVTALSGSVPNIGDSESGFEWSIRLLDQESKRYKIQNERFKSWAACNHQPNKGDFIIGKDRAYPWTVKPTAPPGRYTISMGSNPELFWCLPDDQEGTPLELLDAPNDPRCHWIFTPAGPLIRCLSAIQSAHSEGGEGLVQALNSLPSYVSPNQPFLHLCAVTGVFSRLREFSVRTDDSIRTAAIHCLVSLVHASLPDLRGGIQRHASESDQFTNLSIVLELVLSPEAVDVLASDQNLIQSLVLLLESSNEGIQTRAAEILAWLTKPSCGQALARNAHIGPSLEHLISSDSPAKRWAVIIRDYVSSPLRETPLPPPPSYNLSRGTVQRLADAAQSGNSGELVGIIASLDEITLGDPLALGELHDRALIMLVGLLQSPCRDVAVRAGRALSHLITDAPSRQTAFEAGAVPSLVRLMGDLMQANLVDECRQLTVTLFELTRHRPVLKLAFLTGAVQIILQLIRGGSEQELSPVVGALGNLSTYPAARLIAAQAIPRLSQFLLSTDATLLRRAVFAFRALSFQTPSPWLSDAKQAIPQLVTLLDHPDPPVVNPAIEALRNLCRCAETRKAAIDAHSIQFLERLLDSGLSTTKVGAVSLLRLLIKSSTAREACLEGQIIGSLVKLLHATGLAVRSEVAAALRALAFTEEGQRTVVKFGAIPPLVQLIANTDDKNALMRVAGALRNLTATHRQARVAVLKAEGIPALLKLARNGDVAMQREAVQAIANVTVLPTAQLAAVEANTIRVLESLLGNPEICYGATVALAHISECYPAQRIVHLEGLQRVLDGPVIEARSEAVKAILHIMRGSEEVRGVAIFLIPSLVKRLYTDDPDQLSNALKAIQSITSMHVVAVQVANDAGIIGALMTAGKTKAVQAVHGEVKRALDHYTIVTRLLAQM